MKDNNAEMAVNVSILDKEYLISCSDEERSTLISAARLLDTKMREIRASGKVIGSDRIAVMAGLNIAHDLITNNSDEIVKSNTTQIENDEKTRIQTMQEKIDQVLSNQRKLEL